MKRKMSRLIENRFFDMYLGAVTFKRMAHSPKTLSSSNIHLATTVIIRLNYKPSSISWLSGKLAEIQQKD